jgi:hypothetical protein
MAKVAVITHCYAVDFPHYAQHLKFQLAQSMVHHKPSRVAVKFIICCWPADRDTNLILFNAMELNSEQVEVVPLGMGKRFLFRRAVGRNIAALEHCEDCDVVWFTDVDYSAGPGVLDQLPDLVTDDDRLYCPKKLWINPDHETGDRMVLDNWDERHPIIPGEKFVARNQRVIIGGCQMVTGNTARKFGYCEGNKMAEPLTESDLRKDGIFRRCRCDQTFRKVTPWAGPSIKIDVEPIYRIRHTENHNTLRASRV